MSIIPPALTASEIAAAQHGCFSALTFPGPGCAHAPPLFTEQAPHGIPQCTSLLPAPTATATGAHKRLLSLIFV